LEDAIHFAGVDGLIAGLPSGAETPLSRTRTGGSDLSGGQWQRLALARVLYAVRNGADVVVLDEPTAHLDVPAEVGFFNDVTAAVGDATIVLISHRMSTVRHADQIVFLQDGRIVESGDHESLMAAKGHYAQMFELQAARFTQPDADPASEMEVHP
jgi:ATP-binding cassette subfamily B protein